MKTTKLILSIALVALAATSFAQRTFIIERLLPNYNHQVAYCTAENITENNRIEIWIHDLQGRASKKVSWDVYEAPVVSRTIFVEQVEVFYEEGLGLENWMTAPFENDMAEEELNVESWMTAPFKSNLTEEELHVESWMTTPFKNDMAEKELNVESWMTAPWI